MRNLSFFGKTYKKKSANLRINPPKLLREKRAPPRIEECLGGNAATEFDKDIASYYRKIYYGYLDYKTNAILIALINKILKSILKLENLFQAAKGDDFHAEYYDVLSIYRKDFDDNRFQVKSETLSENCKELLQHHFCSYNCKSFKKSQKSAATSRKSSS